MKVSRKQLNELYEYLGADPDGWADELILKKCNDKGHLDLLRDGGDIADVKLARLYNEIIKANENGEKVELEGATPVTEKTNGKAPKAKAKGKPIKAPKAAAKPSANGKAKKEANKDLRGPGVIEGMIEALQTASKTKPLTKKEVLDRLCKKFKDREPGSMWNTTSSYIPNRIYMERGYKVETNGDGGFWINPKAKPNRPSKEECEKLMEGLRRKPKTKKPAKAQKGKDKKTKSKTKKPAKAAAK